MKYLEEILQGDCFSYNHSFYIMTNDFKKNGDRLSIDLKTGYSKWLKPGEIVTLIDIFTIDKDNNIIAIKERQKETTND